MAITDHFRENAYKHVPIKSSGVLFTYFISEVIKHLDGKQIIILSAPWGATVNICKTLPPSRQNRAGNNENTHINNYTKHSFRNSTGEIPEDLIDLKCKIPTSIRKSAGFLCMSGSRTLIMPIGQDRICPRDCPGKGIDDGGMPGKNSRVQHYKYVLFEEGLLSVLGEKFGKKILTDC